MGLESLKFKHEVFLDKIEMIKKTAASQFHLGVFDEPKYQSLVRGKIAYNVKDSMKVGSQYKAVVGITKALNDSILFLNLDSTKFKVEEIKISSRVRVTLLDPSNNKNFNIVALNTEEQLVDTASNTIWSWNINPLQSGKNTLILRANVKVFSDLGETSKDITVFKKINFCSCLATFNR